VGTDTIKIGKGAEFYYFFALMTFILGLTFYYCQIWKNKIFNHKIVFIVMFVEIIIFWFVMAKIHSIEWGQRTSFG
jgi:hypothetical protein